MGGGGGSDAGNVFSKEQAGGTGIQDQAYKSIHQAMNYTPGQAAQDTLSNPIYGGINTQLTSTQGQINNLQNSGFSLQPQDYQMYGQAANQIAQNSGQQENSLANALSQRGLSNSGIAGGQFAAMEGGKNQQLANQMMNLQQNRFSQNMQNLNSARQYASNLGNQMGSAVGQTINEKNEQAAQGNNWLTNNQNQSNENFAQQQQSKPSSPLGLIGTIVGGVGGAFAGNPMLGASLGGSLGGAIGGAKGGGGAPSSGPLGGGAPIDFNGPNPYSTK